MATTQQPQAVRQQTSTTNRSTDASAAGGKYSVEQLTFPSDLFSAGPAKYANSWMMININMLEQSKYLGQTAQADLSKSEAEAANRRDANTDARNNSVAGLAGSAATTGAVVGAASVIKDLKMTDFLVKNKSARNAALAKAGAEVLGKSLRGAAIGGAAVGIVAASAGTAKRETKRIAAAIQLPMPNDLITSYGARWGEDSTNLFDVMARGLGNLGSGVVDAAAAASLGAAGIIQAQGLSAATGLAVNPKKEMFFESIDFRTFQLGYKLYPKSAQEARIIHDIIFHLKFHMHPEYKSEGRYTFVYPSEFDITFFHRGEENDWVNKIATCVLTNLNVNYTPDGQWAQHSEGQPNAIQIQMTFKELTVLTKEMIDKGF